MKKSHGVTILGQKLQIRSDDGADHVQAVCDYVNEKMGDLRGAASLPTQNLALLTALNIADELFKERARYDGLKEKIRSKSESLLSMLERKGFGG